ncbi:NADH dehydrogenase [ubiquinone] 1 beta subcomplex subunit 2, mitochondrial-like [Ornithodoros turicata]|uniref:NADH dehydrogenase [ubiquinone] 1 beta subcomplex subunit 2, mitochondrial-like n=1 Tax=Ornithodoros turicata TaxID=34597 RepID=UPI00313A1FF2
MLGSVLRSAVRAPLRRNGAVRILKRNSGNWYYRQTAPPEKQEIILADIMGTAMWWWILWHVFTDYHHIFGHFPDVEPESWTDSMLGIPQDDEE